MRIYASMYERMLTFCYFHYRSQSHTRQNKSLSIYIHAWARKTPRFLLFCMARVKIIKTSCPSTGKTCNRLYKLRAFVRQIRQAKNHATIFVRRYTTAFIERFFDATQCEAMFKFAG